MADRRPADVIIRPRSDWAAAPATSRVPLSPKRMQVHWEGTPLGLTSPDQVPARILATQRFHMGSRAMSDIAYNLLVDPWGGVWSGRGLGVRSGANGTTESNRDNLAVCVLLGEGDPPASDAVFAALAELRDELGLPLIAHRDVKPTACPGDHIAGWVHANAQPLPAVQLPQVPQEDDMTAARIVGFNEYGNRWLVGTGPALNLSGELYASLRKDVPEVVGPAHPLMLKGLLEQSGLSQTDLVAT